MSQLRIREVDATGQAKGVYVTSGAGSLLHRVNNIRPRHRIPLTRRLLAIFLPTGYPATVSPDYTAYHVYNALQAFSSSIAGLLASRAVLQGLGVGDESASATNAMLLNVLQESMGRVATIMFAHQVGTRIEAECKMYRLLADVLNDTAMVSDCLSPLLPKMIRVPLLGASSVFRALCGVAGGSSKATLSAHFARAGNIGELNAKDSSQETVISLLGMWVGGIIVAYATSTIATWIWLVVLLIAHLVTNYLAVSSVSVHSINRQRANLIFSSLMSTGHAPSPEQVARRERIFEKRNVLRWEGGKVLGTCEIGVPFAKLVHHMNRIHSPQTPSLDPNIDISEVCTPLADEHYLLGVDPAKRLADIVLANRATVHTQLKAWSHALQVMQKIDQLGVREYSGAEIFGLIQLARHEHDTIFDDWMQQIQDVGWHTQTSTLDTTRANRVVLDQ